jgi:hypothetical protein
MPETSRAFLRRSIASELYERCKSELASDQGAILRRSIAMNYTSDARVLCERSRSVFCDAASRAFASDATSVF